MDRTILLVDDEPNVLKSLIRSLRRCDYAILSASSGQEGLDILKENDIGVIVSDQRMPRMTGIEFLSQVKEAYPDIVRIILSGYTDLKTVTEAINKGAIYKFLTKPWDDGLLRKNIEEAFRYYELHHENEQLKKELELANEQLSEINQGLEQRVAEKTQELLLNIRSLEISRNVLEHLPIAVVGIDDNGHIAVANGGAQQLLGGGKQRLIACDAREVLPTAIYELLQHAGRTAATCRCVIGKGDGRSYNTLCPEPSNTGIQENHSEEYDICCYKLGPAKGTVILMSHAHDKTAAFFGASGG